MITFTISIAGDTKTLARFQRLERRIADFRPLWPEMIAVFSDITNRAFDTEGASTSAGPWKPLAPATVKERERQGFPPAPILQRTGELRRRVTLPRTSQASASRLELTVDSDIYAFHQSTGARTKLPRRAPVSFTSSDRARFRQTLVAYVNRAITDDIAGEGDEL